MVLEEEGGDPARQAAAPGGGGTEKGVVDQVGEGQGYLPAPPGGGARGGYLPRACLLVPILVRAETLRPPPWFQPPPPLPPPPSPRPPILPASLRFGLPSPSAPSALLVRAARFHTRHWLMDPSLNCEPHPPPYGVGPPYPAREPAPHSLLTAIGRRAWALWRSLFPLAAPESTCPVFAARKPLAAAAVA